MLKKLSILVLVLVFMTGFALAGTNCKSKDDGNNGCHVKAKCSNENCKCGEKCTCDKECKCGTECKCGENCKCGDNCKCKKAA